MPVVETILYLLHRLADHKEDYAPFQINWVGVQASRYTAQSPLLTEEPSGFFTQYSELLSSAQDFFDVPLAYEVLPRRAAPSSGAC